MPRSSAPHYLMSGYQNFGRGISHGIDRIMDFKIREKERNIDKDEKKKESKAMMQGFEMFYNNSPELQEALKIEDFDDLSPNAVRGITAAITAKAAMADAQFKPYFMPGEEAGGPKGSKIFMQNPKQGLYIKPEEAMSPGTGPVMSSDKKFYRSPNEDKWRPLPTGSSGAPKLNAPDLKRYTEQKAQTVREIKELELKIKEGGTRPGWDMNFLFGNDSTRTRKLEELYDKLSGLDAVLEGRDMESASKIDFITDFIEDYGSFPNETELSNAKAKGYWE